MFKARHSQRSNSSSTKSVDVELPDDPKHWSHNIQEVSLSLNSRTDSLMINGGAENGELCWISGIQSEGGNITVHGGVKFSIGDILLEVENQPVVGFTSYDLSRWLDITTKDGNVVSIKYVSLSFLTKDLRSYLNTRFQKHSLDHELQHAIRLNVYRRTVPCTTRKMREGEVDGVDYRFLSVDEFQILEGRGSLLESGTYSGNFYGTPLPLHREEIDFGENSTTPSDHGAAGDNNGDIGLNIVKLKLMGNNYKENDDDGEDDGLPPGWERVDNYPEYGVFYVDHVNKCTQFERPQKAKVLKKVWSLDDLRGEFVTTRLVKGSNGLGFTIIGGDETNDLLQVKTIVPGGPAYLDHKLQKGDVLVSLDGQQVLGSTHKEIINLFQAIPIGTPVHITVCRGYPMTFDPNDPNHKVIRTIAVQPPEKNMDQNVSRSSPAKGKNSSLDGSQASTSSIDFRRSSDHPTNESHILKLIRGPDGFRFTLSDLLGGHVMGQRVRSILDRSRCGNLREGDVIEKINNITVSRMTHLQVVEILKACPVGKETEFVILREVPPPLRSSSVTPSIDRSPQISLDSEAAFYSRVIKPSWKNSNHLGNHQSSESIPWHTNISSNQGKGFKGNKTPGPVLIKSPNEGWGVGEETYGIVPGHDLRSTSRSSCLQSDNGQWRNTPDFTFNYISPEDLNNHGSKNIRVRDHHQTIVGSSSSSASATPIQMDGLEKFDSTLAEHQVFPVRLFRQADGFGLQLGGGTEEGISKIIIGHIAPGGAADMDGRMKVGDEVVTIDSVSTFNVTFRVAKEMLSAASGRGLLNLELRRQIREDFSTPDRSKVQLVSQNSSHAAFPIDQQQVQRSDVFHGYQLSGCHEVRLTKSDRQSFGFTIISTSAKSGSRICSIVPNGPASQCKQLSIDDLLVTINGVDVRDMQHEDIVELIRSSGNTVTLVVAPPPLSGDHSSLIMADAFNTNGQDHHQYQTLRADEGQSKGSKFHFIEINKGQTGFGFTLSGGRDHKDAPHCVLNIARNGAAHQEGNLMVGDRLVEVNGQNVSNMTHGEVIKAVQSNPSRVALLIKRQT